MADLHWSSGGCGGHRAPGLRCPLTRLAAPPKSALQLPLRAAARSGKGDPPRRQLRYHDSRGPRCPSLCPSLQPSPPAQRDKISGYHLGIAALTSGGLGLLFPIVPPHPRP